MRTSNHFKSHVLFHPHFLLSDILRTNWVAENSLRTDLNARIRAAGAGAGASLPRARFLETREGVAMASGVSTSEGSCWVSVAGAPRRVAARVLALPRDGGMLLCSGVLSGKVAELTMIGCRPVVWIGVDS